MFLIKQNKCDLAAELSNNGSVDAGSFCKSWFFANIGSGGIFCEGLGRHYGPMAQDFVLRWARKRGRHQAGSSACFFSDLVLADMLFMGVCFLSFWSIGPVCLKGSFVMPLVLSAAA